MIHIYIYIYMYILLLLLLLVLVLVIEQGRDGAAFSAVEGFTVLTASASANSNK